MALRVEIWGLQLIRPLARAWQRQKRLRGDRRRTQTSGSISPVSKADDLGVWVGAIRLLDLSSTRKLSPATQRPKRPQSQLAHPTPIPPRDKIVYLKPSVYSHPARRSGWNEAEQRQKVQHIFEQNRIALEPSSVR